MKADDLLCSRCPSKGSYQAAPEFERAAWEAMERRALPARLCFGSEFLSRPTLFTKARDESAFLLKRISLGITAYGV